MPEEQKPTGIVLVADGIDECLDTTLKEALAPTDYALMHVRNAVEAVATLERIVDRDCGFFDALAALIESGVSLTLLLGNHDIEMSLPAVRSYLRARLGVKRFGAVQFIYDGEAYVVGDTLIEHGNRYDGWNAVDYDSLRRYRSESSRRLPLSPEAEFDPPVGSQ